MPDDSRVGTGHGTVALIVVGYGQARFLPELFRAIREQTRRPDQLILCDDASPDDSARLMREFAAEIDIPTTLVLNRRNRGLTPTLNVALGHVTTDFYAYVSADDSMLPERLERQRAHLLAQPPETSFSYGDAARIDEFGQPLPGTFFDQHRTREPVSDHFVALLQDNWIPACALMVRTSAARAIGGYDERLFYEDHDLLLRLSRHGRGALLPETLAIFRVVPSSMGGRRFRASDPDYYWARSTALAKHLGISAGHNATILRTLRPLVLTLWLRGDRRPEVAGWQRAIFRHHPRPVTALYAAASLLPGAAAARVVAGVRAARHRILS